MTLKKAQEIIEVFVKERELWPSKDLQDALNMALVCMSFIDGILKRWKWLIGQGPFEEP